MIETERCVYVFEAEVGRVKVGISDSVNRRIGEVQREFPGKLDCPYFTKPTPLARKIEGATHSMMRHDRLRGEWFNVSSADAILAVKLAKARVEAGLPLNYDCLVTRWTIAKLRRNQDDEPETMYVCDFLEAMLNMVDLGVLPHLPDSRVLATLRGGAAK